MYLKKVSQPKRGSTINENEKEVENEKWITYNDINRLCSIHGHKYNK